MKLQQTFSGMIVLKLISTSFLQKKYLSKINTNETKPSNEESNKPTNQ